MCKISLFMETKIPIRLNIFDLEDFWKTHAGCIGSLLFKFSKIKLFLGSNPREDFLWKTPGRLMEDFDLGGKPKLFQNLGGNHKFY
ncbi:hypothetical protein YC2023_036405 [Brassica napus]